jgi:hypothetical protein
MVTPFTATQILAALAAPINATRKALDDGVSFADTTLDGQPRCPHTWATLVRYRARNHLIERRDSEAAWTLKKLRNSGFAISLPPFAMRTLKSQKAGPPSPGRNLARQDYWQQVSQDSLFSDTDFDAGQAANLILDWTIGADRGVEVALSKPLGVWKYQGQPNIEWRRPVSFDASDNPVFRPAAQDVAVERRFDIDELGEDGTGTEE